MGCQIQEIFSDVEICDLVASVTNAMNKSIGTLLARHPVIAQPARDCVRGIDLIGASDLILGRVAGQGKAHVCKFAYQQFDIVWVREINECVNPVRPFANKFRYDIADIGNGVDIIARTAD